MLFLNKNSLFYFFLRWCLIYNNSTVKLRLKVRKIAKKFPYAFFENSLPTFTKVKRPKRNDQKICFWAKCGILYPKTSFLGKIIGILQIVNLMGHLCKHRVNIDKNQLNSFELKSI